MTDPNPLFVVPRYWPAMGGAELHSRRLVQELSGDLDIAVARLSASNDTPTDFAFSSTVPSTSLDGDIRIHDVGATGVTRSALRCLAQAPTSWRPVRRCYNTLARPELRRQIGALAKNRNILHGIYNGCTPAFEALADLDQPFVFTPLVHTSKPWGTAWSSPQFKRLYDRADALIAMTHFEKEWLADLGTNPDKIHVCPMAPLFDVSEPRPDAFRHQWQLHDHPFILFLGRLETYKGYRTLIAAMNEVWSQHPNLRVVIAGPGSPCVEQPDARLVFTGALSESDKKSALAASTLLCVPSTEESLGVVYLEAWSFGKPVIAADIPAMRSVIDHGQDGWVVPQTPTAIAQQIREAMSQPDRLAAMGLAGARKVEREYNWAESARRLRAIYAELI